jgi:hypothetical protein
MRTKHRSPCTDHIPQERPALINSQGTSTALISPQECSTSTKRMSLASTMQHQVQATQHSTLHARMVQSGRCQASQAGMPTLTE